MIFNLIKNKERGALNLISISISLPILILLLSAAIDFIRLPILKAELISSLSSSYDLINEKKILIKDKGENIEKELNKTLDKTLNFILEDITNNSVNSNIFSVSKKDLKLNLSIYKLNRSLKNKNCIKDITLIKEKGFNEKDSASFNSKKYLLNALKSINNTKNNRICILKNSPFIPSFVVVINASVRVKNITGIKKLLTKDKNSAKTHTLNETLLRPICQLKTI